MNISANTATIPVRNTQKDFYNWEERHQLKLSQAASGSHDLVFIGDSITHMFEVPDRGLAIWQERYGHRRALNLGYGWDRSQNVLWRLEAGEFAGQRPKLVVLNIGTNNLTDNDAGPANTAVETVGGIRAICDWIHRQSPETVILLMAVFPRGLADEPIRCRVNELNAELAPQVKGLPRLIHLDIGSRFLDSDGEIPLSLMDDRCHPTANGYAIWAEAIEPVVARYVG